MQDTPDGLIEELRFRAIEEAAASGVSVQQTLAWEAAEMLAEFLAVLRAVARGEMHPATVRQLLDPVSRLVRSLAER